jgi:uncharacterized glyoxalase superfamily protein PhnB
MGAMGISLKSVAPVLPVRNVAKALDHYRRLGFKTNAYCEAGQPDDDPVYGFIHWDSVDLHLTRVRDLDPKSSTSACYLYVDDADALYEAWTTAGVTGRFEPPEDTPYDLREFAHVDPDGNLLRVGSPLSKA